MTYKFILLVADWLRVAVNGRGTVTKTKNYICMRRYKLISTHANYRNVYESCVCLHEQFQQTNLTWYMQIAHFQGLFILLKDHFFS